MDAKFDNNDDDCDDHENYDDKRNVDDDLTDGGKDGKGGGWQIFGDENDNSYDYNDCYEDDDKGGGWQNGKI